MKFKIQVDVDFNIYPRGVWDENDFVVNGKKIDVKASRSGAKWLLVECKKLEFRKKEGIIPFAFVFCITEWHREHDVPTGRVFLGGFILTKELCNIELIGKVRNKNLCGNKNIIFIPENGNLPLSGVKLQTDNLACHLDNLCKDRSLFVKLVNQEEIL